MGKNVSKGKIGKGENQIKEKEKNHIINSKEKDGGYRKHTSRDEVEYQQHNDRQAIGDCRARRRRQDVAAGRRREEMETCWATRREDGLGGKMETARWRQ
ncbi:hypothetical protein ACLOJK_032292 [Asimina triloba]